MKLHGKIIISGIIFAKTGLHIGGSDTGLEIGSTDNVVIRDPLTSQPYIPGSSLRGALRSVMEIGLGKPIEHEVVSGDKKKVRIHMCDGNGKTEEDAESEYNNCEVCTIFGLPAEITYAEPTRLYVRDAKLEETSAGRLEYEANTDMPFTEVKTEVVIDRITSQATPRQVERVPAGSEFEFEMVYNIFKQADIDKLKALFSGMKWLEDDYLGGGGSRGSGKIEFQEVDVEWKSGEYYTTGDATKIQKLVTKKTVEEILKDYETWVKVKVG